MELFKRILKTAVDGEASDVLVKVGGPIIFRIHGDLGAVEAPIPTEEWLNRVVEGIVPPHAKKRLDAEREADFSNFIPGTGRFRRSFLTARQFCLAMRYVKTQVPAFESLAFGT
jgi:Tfp pilus assembly pilus retraction ATPase PilT